MTMKISITSLLVSEVVAVAPHTANQPHYLVVSLLNYPQSKTPHILQNHTSGTYIPHEDSPVPVPFDDVPKVGFSDMDELMAGVCDPFFSLNIE
jgi:hypothetical protein